MKPRRAPVIVKAFDKGVRRRSVETDPYDDVQLEKVLKELSFIRIKLDQIILPDINPFIEKLHNYREFYGFQLEYSFPCLDVVSKSLKTTVRIPEKEVDVMKIVFNHRRVVLLNMHKDQVDHWRKAQLTIHLLVNMAVNGRHTTRPLAKCHVRLSELTYPPYIIQRGFDFLGDEFEGTAEVRIDIGSRVKSLMEKLTNLRGDRSLEDTFIVTDRPVVTRARSRSSSRCRAHSSHTFGVTNEKSEIHRSRRPNSVTSSRPSTSTSTPIFTQNHPERHPLNQLLRPRIPSSSSVGSDSVFTKAQDQGTLRSPQAFDNPDYFGTTGHHERIHKTVTESHGASTVADTVEEVSRRGGKYYLEVTVHHAFGLPPVQNESGIFTSPSTFVSVLGRDGDLRSPVFRNSRNPSWNFTCRFAISSERRNLVVKVFHRGVLGDVPLGFVTISLPTSNIHKVVYEMTDVTPMAAKFTSEVPMLTISIEKIINIDDDEDNFENRIKARTSSRSSRSTQSPPSIQRKLPYFRIESPPILESSEVIKEKMRRCMADLDQMMRGMNNL